MRFQLRKCELALFREAIDLGDRLKRMPEATSDDVDNIERFQTVLRRLPEATPGIDANYGFGVMSFDIAYRGVNRAWYVDQEEMVPGDPELSVYSIYTTVPHPDEEYDRYHESWFVFGVDRASYVRNARWYWDWIAAVRDPDRWRHPQQEFEVETEFSPRPRWRRWAAD